MIFRKNYLPQMKIVQDFDAKKWYAHTKDGDYVFGQFKDGTYGVLVFSNATRFETLDCLLKAMYEYACKNHLEKIKTELTHNTININT